MHHADEDTNTWSNVPKAVRTRTRLRASDPNCQSFTVAFIFSFCWCRYSSVALLFRSLLIVKCTTRHTFTKLTFSPALATQTAPLPCTTASGGAGVFSSAKLGLFGLARASAQQVWLQACRRSTQKQAIEGSVTSGDVISPYGVPHSSRMGGGVPPVSLHPYRGALPARLCAGVLHSSSHG